MKTRILITGLAFVSAISFGQKKEIKKAEKALKSNEYSEALSYLNEAEPMLGAADDEMKAQFYAARGEALLGSGGTDYTKLKGAAEAFSEALKLDPKMEAQLSAPLQNLRAGLINGAIKDQNAGQYKMATDKLYTSYMVSKDPSDLYFAAGNAVNGKDYDTSLEYYQMLLDTGYTGETQEFVATRKETGEVEPFDTENLRNIAVKSGEFIKPEIRVTESRKGEILRNMTLIYIEQGNNEKATSLMKAARAENPDDIYLMRADADMSYKMDDVERYNELMEKIVASDPENPEIYFNLGVGSAEIGNTDKAIGYYKKALELDPNYEAALINVAVLKLSKEDKLVEQMNSLGNSRADNQKYDELKQQRNDVYKETMPYLEKALQLNPNNPEVMRTLMNIYGQLAEDAKFKEMKAKLDALETKG
ncbi:tetratricopeptide repeat protein [Aequorivita lipolytica]|uniref:Tetratricopeptide repeat protein n=1 Tax=Aequorivita lipolytica TaxID=153267 RepID=A0A5C6YP12_9FLAO|nr:tetratricopeptide repeat protein [Aequorivita lipolytica]TXD69080.1 tetratricopeptide repeat protein [Aequorivita lipolytica]SRX51351.1 Photosystem I assembly protein Ycf3 [Aequorivita lipolytica]